MGMHEPTIAATADAQRRAFTPVTADNHVFRWLPTGSEAIEAMLQHIERAEYYVALELYICKPGAVSDRFRVALIAACLRGVHVQVLLDAFGSTAFHRDLPRVARLLPIPRRYEAQGVRRYGFHGLSYAFLMQELARVVLAHLGNGASLAAVHEGKCIDTSIGFTPTAGVPMSTRSGDFDPGLVGYLARTEHIDAQQFNDMVNFQSGLLGISETSSDMRDLLEHETKDVRAAEAVALFCYQVKKWIGSFAAALGGLDTLVFAGGIGEHAPVVVRERICDGLGFLGNELDEKRNAAGAAVISTEAGRVAVRVMRTDEEWMIAKTVCRVFGVTIEQETSS